MKRFNNVSELHHRNADVNLPDYVHRCRHRLQGPVAVCARLVHRNEGGVPKLQTRQVVLKPETARRSDCTGRIGRITTEVVLAVLNVDQEN